jgi:hypothetical protein
MSRPRSPCWHARRLRSRRRASDAYELSAERAAEAMQKLLLLRGHQLAPAFARPTWMAASQRWRARFAARSSLYPIARTWMRAVISAGVAAPVRCGWPRSRRNSTAAGYPLYSWGQAPLELDDMPAAVRRPSCATRAVIAAPSAGQRRWQAGRCLTTPGQKLGAGVRAAALNKAYNLTHHRPDLILTHHPLIPERTRSWWARLRTWDGRGVSRPATGHQMGTGSFTR